MFEYRIAAAKTHRELEKEINQAAGDGPVIVYAWNTGLATADHAVLLRRTVPA